MIYGSPFGLAHFGAGPEWDAGIVGTHMAGNGDIEALPLDPRLAMLADQSRTAVHVVIVSAWHLADEEAVTLTWSDAEFISAGDDTPASASFQDRVKGGYIGRDLMRPAGFGGLVDGRGEVMLENRDGALDDLTDIYALSGRPVEIRTGLLGDRVDDMMPIFVGTVFDCYIEEDEVRLLIRDRAAEFEVPLVGLTYTGAGGKEGTSDLLLKRKPWVVGICYHLAPVLVDPQRNIYQVFVDASFTSFTVSAFVNGAQLNFLGLFSDYASFAAYAPPAGYASGCHDDWKGMFVRLGSVPDNQVVTVSAQKKEGSPLGSVLATKSVALAQIAIVSGGLTWADDFDQASFSAYHAAHPYLIGFYADENDESTAGEAMDRICGERSFAVFNRAGKLRAGLVAAAGAIAAVALDATNIFTVSAPRLPDGLSPPVQRFRVGWAKRWIADMSGRVAAGVDAILRAFLAQPVRTAGYEDSTLKTAYRLAQDRHTVDELYDSYIDAASEAEALFALYSTGRGLREVEAARPALIVEPGQTFTVTDARFGLAAGKALVSVGDRYDLATRRVTLKGLG